MKVIVKRTFPNGTIIYYLSPGDGHTRDKGAAFVYDTENRVHLEHLKMCGVISFNKKVRRNFILIPVMENHNE